MTIRVLVNGAKGRMGQAALQALGEDKEFIIAGAIDHEDDLAAAIKDTHAKVVVDFTTAKVVQANVNTIIAAHAHPVVGTSGLLLDDVKQFQLQCAKLKLGGIIAPNFSIGAVLLMKHAQEIAKYFSHVEIIEMHHDGKLDSPSGTSLRTAEMIATNIQARRNQETKNHETIAGARGASHHKIPIHAVRLPGLVAHEQVIFGSLGETLSLRHDSIDRLSFMPGVLLACKKVMALKQLVYGLEHIL